MNERPHHLAHIALLLGLMLTAACQPAAPPATEVEPPTIVTVVVTATPDETTPTPEITAEAHPESRYPEPTQVSMEAVDEYFERGYAVWLSDWSQIWVFVMPLVAPGELDLGAGLAPATPPASDNSPLLLTSGGPWYVFEDTFDPTVDLDTDPNLEPPEGMQQPKGGLGRIWRENPDLQSALGWALDWEQPYWTLINTYAIGVLGEDNSFVQTDHIYTIYTSDGTLLYVHEAAGIWSRP